MTPLVLGVAALIALASLIAARLPIAHAMLMVGGAGVVLLSGPVILLRQLETLAYGLFSTYDLSVVPLFLLMGHLATAAGLSERLFRAANAWLGRYRGGVAMATVAACAGFGAVCGSSLATVSAMGRVALPELRRLRYAAPLATGTIAAGGVLGILIPPSVVLVVYAVVVEASIVSLFKAALLPALLAVSLFMATIALVVRLVPAAGPVGERVGAVELRRASIGVVPVVVVFGIVVGGLYGGWFNPTPAAAIGVAAVLTHGVVVGRLTWFALRAALLQTAATTSMIYLVLLGAELFKILMARAGLPQAVAEWMVATALPPLTVLILILAVLVVLGCLMESLSMVLLAVPFFWPALVALNGGDAVSAASAGFGMTTEDLKIWFGILALVVVELGLITPPVGLNVLAISSLSKDVPARAVFKGTAPFLIAELVRIGLLIALPVLTLWLA